MAAPKGNQFWKLRSKHGRDKLFETPELLWEAACEYFEWCDKNPHQELRYFNTKNGIEEKKAPKLRAYTLKGLCLYLDCSTKYFLNFEENNKVSEDFMDTLIRIREVIYEQKYSGAAAELLNPSFIGKDIGLVDRKELDHKGLKLGAAFEEKYKD